ncbi:MAG: chorismate mutase [Alphaproteobacteria bacterium]|nr:chorismate mutase [Alphaproteobacteria bacterium]MBF0335595.1 chorismate mutase [Alphaproteobacteria bacterium]MBF0373979.1 chorismate mutase [Alphaproteobacteria bacterium]
MTECRSLDEVRQNIDRLDAVLVPLLAERSRFVAQAARFKPTEADVVVPSRIEAIVERVRAMAEREGADPMLFEDLWRGMIDAFCRFEARNWRRLHGEANPSALRAAKTDATL